MRATLLLLVMLFTTLSTPAPAHELSGGVSEADVAQALAQKGLPVRLGNDSFKEPLMESYWGRLRFYIYFYDCDQARRCKNIQFRTGLATRGALSLARVNEWSTRWRFGRLYLDPEGDAILDYDVDVKRGATPELLAAVLERWIEVMRDAEGFLGWRK